MSNPFVSFPTQPQNIKKSSEELRTNLLWTAGNCVQVSKLINKILGITYYPENIDFPSSSYQELNKTLNELIIALQTKINDYE